MMSEKIWCRLRVCASIWVAAATVRDAVKMDPHHPQPHAVGDPDPNPTAIIQPYLFGAINGFESHGGAREDLVSIACLCIDLWCYSDAVTVASSDAYLTYFKGTL